jgi:hypothetical protein
MGSIGKNMFDIVGLKNQKWKRKAQTTINRILQQLKKQ